MVIVSFLRVGGASIPQEECSFCQEQHHLPPCGNFIVLINIGIKKKETVLQCMNGTVGILCSVPYEVVAFSDQQLCSVICIYNFLW